MAVSSTITLPAQPVIGVVEYIPLGGDGKSAPLGCYLVENVVDGDAGGGLATLNVNLDRRYTNLVAFVNLRASSSAAAPDFFAGISAQGIAVTVPSVQIVGTMPQTAMTGLGPNAAFLWYPPPIYYPGTGRLTYSTVNVDATEQYTMTAQIYTFDIDIRRLAPLYLLQLNVPGVSAPAAV